MRLSFLCLLTFTLTLTTTTTTALPSTNGINPIACHGLFVEYAPAKVSQYGSNQLSSLQP